MQLLDGKYVSEKLKLEIAEEAAKILERTGRKPHLVAVFLVDFLFLPVQLQRLD